MMYLPRLRELATRLANEDTMMAPKIIKTDKEHAATLKRIEEIFTAKPGTPEGDELELLVHLVDHYEKAAHPMAADKLSGLAAITNCAKAILDNVEGDESAGKRLIDSVYIQQLSDALKGHQ